MTGTITPSHPLYKRGTKGEVRIWYVDLREFNGQGFHRVVSGIHGGKLTKSEWTLAQPKNVGRSNETTSIEQAQIEAENAWTIKSERGYFTSIDQIDNVAFTKPMLAVDIEKRKGKFSFSDRVYAQPKLDGIRCIARADGLWTRTGKPITAVPHIVNELATFFEKDPALILDGELYNHELKDDFNTITSIVRKATPNQEELDRSRELIEYHIYDVASQPGSHKKRMASFFSLATRPTRYLRVVETRRVWNQNDLDTHYAQWMEEGYEGQMVRLNGPYENKRSSLLLKRKDFESQEFPVIRIEEGKGNWSGCIKRFVVRLPDGTENEATPRGTQDQLRALLQSGNTPDWATVRFFGFTPDNKLRFPIVTDWGFNKRAD